MSDIHIESYTWQPYFARHFKLALKDIKENYGTTSPIVMVGDLVNKGYKEQYDVFNEIISDNYEGGELPPIYTAVGNHEYFHSTYQANQFNDAMNLYFEKTGRDSIYYSVSHNNTKFIILGSESSNSGGYMSMTQFDWLKGELESVSKDTPVYVFMHQALRNTISGSLPNHNIYGFTNMETNLKQLFSNYPNLFIFSGHSHWTLDAFQSVLQGDGNNANYVNLASVAYLWNDEEKNIPGSQGVYVEVYEDYILLKGREFTEYKWVSACQIKIDLK